MMPSRQVFTVLLILCGIQLAFAQRPPVSWTYELERINNHESVVTLKASLAPGWHLYSQHLREGGPIPTLIKSDHSDAYTFVGHAQENGRPVSFYDSLYEMNVIWYADEITFVQQVLINLIIPGSLTHLFR